ncbi:MULTISPECIES: regulatory protein RecX [Sphingobium]|uniref:RecX family transcriptional regulator n=1 Tax=Sphingobium fuliginis ATCC 27551 TaxID=1208342 RepID=A0A5B8CGZ3_SPHSA|nr:MULTISPECIES: RecX family transcriptional regulator [Sphingobium]KXU31286.1 RecX family transcriptional regulator [Sphingobium sp. AM]KYC31331.1 RecX family transcriptional regulator [Sphingobium sp. 22B]OAP31213.1 RecX family transcriptional regulator [Sphingobium sp. 20006FA]QDC38205.1 RecX family transcriptional regulator [Sphingobium fuliginis ATCC 27551]
MTGKRPPAPLDEEAMRELALRYVARFATSRAKLLAYLGRKIKERGWGGEDPADPQALVDRLSELRYVDDAGYAVMKSGALSRRGYGARRVAETLRADGIAEADRVEAHAQTERESWSAADRFARRKRIGPYAQERPDLKQREKWIAAFLRAGHDYATARRWTDAAPGEVPEADE